MIKFAKTRGILLALCTAPSTLAANPQLLLLNEPVDVSGDFRDLSVKSSKLVENPLTGRVTWNIVAGMQRSN